MSVLPCDLTLRPLCLSASDGEANARALCFAAAADAAVILFFSRSLSLFLSLRPKFSVCLSVFLFLLSPFCVLFLRYSFLPYLSLSLIFRVNNFFFFLEKWLSSPTVQVFVPIWFLLSSSLFMLHHVRGTVVTTVEVYSAENAKLLEWIREQLESRGIDSVVYGRYILSMLLMNSFSTASTSNSSSNSANANNTNSNSSSSFSSAGSSSLSSNESSIEKSSSSSASSTSSSSVGAAAAADSAGDRDSGYGTSTGSATTTITTTTATISISSSTSITTKSKPSLSTTLSSSLSAERGGRFCDLHQRLYPGINLHQSRTKLLRESVLGGGGGGGGGKTTGLNTQKPSSTTKFMHRRYQLNGVTAGGGIGGGGGSSGRGSPTDHFLSAAAAAGGSEGGHHDGNHCPDCAARNNHGNAAAAAPSHRPSQQVANVCPSSNTLDYRKVVLADCLKDVLVDGQQVSFVFDVLERVSHRWPGDDELVGQCLAFGVTFILILSPTPD